jgi:lipopolysaccharide biosynthesis regulator YciM
VRLRERVRAAPSDVAALLRLGALCRAAGELEEALQHHRRACELAPTNAEALRHLVQDYEAAGQAEAALEVLERLREVSPHDRWMLERLRDLHVRGERWEEAAAAQAHLLGGVPAEGAGAAPSLGIWCGLRVRAGQTALAAGNAREASAAAREVLRADPSFTPAYLLLGEVYRRQGRPQRATRQWHQAYEATGHTVLLDRLEQVYLGENRPHRLIDLYHQALLRAPDDLRLRYRLATVCVRLEMVDEAAAHLEAVVREAPGFGPALSELADIARRRGQLAQALTYAQRALAASRAHLLAFRCAACGAPAAEWADRCPACGAWNTLTDFLEPRRGAAEPAQVLTSAEA